MYKDVDELLQALRAQPRPLQVTVRTIERPERVAPLGLDVNALEAVLFVGAVSEFLFSYASWLAGEDERSLPYSVETFQQFERERIERIGPGRLQNWVDLYEDKRDDCYRLFRHHLRRRKGGYYAAASAEILRLELVEVWKENPSFRKILATGATAAIVAMAGMFGAVHIIKEYKADDCRREWIAYGKQQAELLRQVGKFQGKFPQSSYTKLQETVEVGIAACGSPLADAGVRVDKDGIVVDISAQASTNNSRR